MSEPFTYPVTDVEATAGPTPSQTVGPFFHVALPYDEGARLVTEDHPGAVRLAGRVTDGDGAPVPDALVEIWQADPHGGFAQEPGVYDAVTGQGFRGFGRCATDAHGEYAFTTLRPAGVPTSDGAAQAPHVAMSVFARGMLRRVVTRVYFEDEDNSGDPLLAGVEEDRRGTLVAGRDDGGYRFDVRLQGADETVFLDVFGR